MPRAIARAVTAIPLRRAPPPKKPAASRPGAPKSRASGPANGRRPRAREADATSASAATTSATAAKPKSGNPSTAGAVDAHGRGGEADGRRGRARSRAGGRTLSIEPGRSAGDGLDPRRFERGQDRRRDGGEPSRPRPRARRRRRTPRPTILRGRQVDARHRPGDGAEAPRAREDAARPPRGAVPATPMSEPFERGRRAKITPRDGADRAQRRDLGPPPQDRDRDGVGDQKHPDEQRQRAERVQVEAEGAHHALGRLAARPGRRLEREARAAAAARALARTRSRSAPGASTTSTRSTRPVFPRSRCAVKTSVRSEVAARGARDAGQLEEAGDANARCARRRRRA